MSASHVSKSSLGGRWNLLHDVQLLSDTQLRATVHFTVEQADGHFIEQPVVPGVLLAEAMGQALGQLAVHRGMPPGRLAGIDRFRLHHPLNPPCTVAVEVSWRGAHEGIASGDASIRMGETSVATGRITGEHR